MKKSDEYKTIISVVKSKNKLIKDTMALVSFATASSTENLRSFRNQRIMSSSSLPFLPIGRLLCSFSSLSLTSETSCWRAEEGGGEGIHHSKMHEKLKGNKYDQEQIETKYLHLRDSFLRE